MIKAVIFDMDGLIIDSEPLWRKAEISVFSKVGIKLTEDDCRETMGYRLNEVVDLWYSRHPWDGPSKRDVESQIIDKVSNLILESGNILPGVNSIMKECKLLGLKMAIASSSPMILINTVVRLLKMEDDFDTLHSAEFESYGKPHPSVFISTALTLGVESENCVVFEDSFHGVIAGLAAKMKVVAVPDVEQVENPKFQAAHLVLNSLKDLSLSAVIQKLT